MFYLFYHKRKIVDIRYYIIAYLIYLAIVIGLFASLKIWGGYVPIEHLLLLVGATCSLYNNKKSKIEIFSNKNKYLICIIYTVLFVYNIYFSNLIKILVLQVMIPFCLLIIIKFNKILDFIGKNSLLLYLYHIQIIMILNQYLTSKNELIYILLFLIISILLMIIWKNIEKYVNNKSIKK